jgi:hypothetical protein
VRDNSERPFGLKRELKAYVLGHHADAAHHAVAGCGQAAAAAGDGRVRDNSERPFGLKPRFQRELKACTKRFNGEVKLMPPN